MTSIVTLELELHALEGWPAWWQACAEAAQRWLRQQRVEARQALALVPQTAHISLLRRGWAHSAHAWLPRLGTPASVAEQLGGCAAPAPDAGPGITFDRTIDLLNAHSLMLRQAWARQWQQRDPVAFVTGVRRLMEAAHDLARTAYEINPDDRPSWMENAKTALTAASGPGLRERILVLTALQWLQDSPQPASDALFRCLAPGSGRPQAVVLAGFAAADRWLQSWTQQAAAHGVPVLLLAPQWDEATPRERHPARQTVCMDLEDEAQVTAARIMDCVAQAKAPLRAPVAVIAQDRLLVRRVRALLEPSGLAIADETGWKLSTTRAATAVMSWLRAAQPQASSDHLLDALKSGWADPVAELPSGLPASASLLTAADELEAYLRRSGSKRAWGVVWPEPLAPQWQAAQSLWMQTRAALQPLRWSGYRSLSQALPLLEQTLSALGVCRQLNQDEAGRQVVSTLRFGAHAGSADPVWQAAAQNLLLDPAGLLKWVDHMLEQGSFVPLAPAEPDVVFTPMNAATLRPFTAVIWPAMDDTHFGEVEPPLAWLGEPGSSKLTLPTRADMQARTWHLMRALIAGQPTYVSWRRRDADRPLGPSPWWERWQLLRTPADAAAWRDAPADPRLSLPLVSHPTPRPQPRLPLAGPELRSPLWPQQISASSYEQLRACPYRFFAHTLLGLREHAELEDGIEARDFGTWLHEVLKRFHDDPDSQEWDGQQGRDGLSRIAQQVQAEWAWDGGDAAADFVPYAAALQRLTAAYVAWWLEHRQAGARIAGMEVSLQATGPELNSLGVTLKGQLDRIDWVSQPGQPGEQALIIDYKTSSQARLRSRMKPLTEDTQLAFYAALLMLAGYGDQTGGRAPRAAYLSLEDRKVSFIEHKEVADSAELLLAGLAQDLQSLSQGHALLALGEGPVCDVCSARGLCRKDDWSDAGQQEGA